MITSSVPIEPRLQAAELPYRSFLIVKGCCAMRGADHREDGGRARVQSRARSLHVQDDRTRCDPSEGVRGSRGKSPTLSARTQIQSWRNTDTPGWLRRNRPLFKGKWPSLKTRFEQKPYKSYLDKLPWPRPFRGRARISRWSLKPKTSTLNTKT